MITKGHQVKGVASVCGVALTRSIIAELLNGVVKRKEAVQGCEYEFAGLFQRFCGTPQDFKIHLICLHQRESAFAKHYGEVKLTVKGQAPGIMPQEFNIHAFSRCLFPGSLQLRLREVDTRDVVSSLCELY